MKKDVSITVLSMCYNKASTILRTYRSLLAQTNYDFEWLIVNDGSTDNIKEVIHEIKIDKFQVRFIDKENEGPAKTFNRGVREASGDIIFRLDPDDFVTPDAIQKILDYWPLVEYNQHLCGLVFLAKFENGDIVGTHPYTENKISNFFNYRIYDHATGDRAEVIKKEVYMEFPWPKYGNEKFVLESSFWYPMAMKYDSYYINYAIYIREYNENSITAASSLTYKKNPVGTIENILTKFRIFNKKRKTMSIRMTQLKGCLLYYRYGLYSNFSLWALFFKMFFPWNFIGVIPGTILHYIDKYFPNFVPSIMRLYHRIRNKDNFSNLKIKTGSTQYK